MKINNNSFELNEQLQVVIDSSDNSTFTDCGKTLQLNTYRDANIAQSSGEGLLPFSKTVKS